MCSWDISTEGVSGRQRKLLVVLYKHLVDSMMLCYCYNSCGAFSETVTSWLLKGVSGEQGGEPGPFTLTF